MLEGKVMDAWNRCKASKFLELLFETPILMRLKLLTKFKKELEELDKSDPSYGAKEGMYFEALSISTSGIPARM